MPRITTSTLLLIPTAALCISVLWAASKFRGPLTLSITIPHGVEIHLDTKQSIIQVAAPKTPVNPLTHPSQQPAAAAHLPEPARSINQALNSFSAYESRVQKTLARKRARFSQVAALHRTLVDSLGYAAHFTRSEAAASTNSQFAAALSDHGRALYGMHRALPSANDVELVDLAFAHLTRDWSDDGAAERVQIFTPIMKALKLEFGENTAGLRVLNPGSGLGRLAHEISQQGYIVDACELDYGSILAYHYLVNATKSTYDHTLYPYVSNWVHQLNPEARYRPVHIPDVLPDPRVRLVEGDFLTEFPESASYDAIVTLFFIDIGQDIVDFLRNIHRLLKPGGLWINLGPFKWGSFAHMQLSAEEVLTLAGMIGFDVDHDSRQSIETLYAHQPESLLKFTYVTQFWTAKKALRS
ncbi:hypothetical protein HGRIS_002042 [Hohenbuehelia grisea]|uniref:Carnosine N-methyltransferase n=1 Tax=Hohenbuehelia grisea TaxID=104357 RepID=A0ABR3JL37_9AGAR